MASAVLSRPRVVADGKFFRLGEKKFFVKGVAYGPFPPNAHGQPLPSPEQTVADLDQIKRLGATVVRVYNVPPRWFLDLAEERQLKVFIDLPWNKHLAIDSRERRAEAREFVRRAVLSCGAHPAVFAYSVANEIPPDLVRWSGTKAVADFIDELVFEAKHADPGCLCTFSNFPPTEFLRPRSVDFVCFNVYLHDEQPFRRYLARLQMTAEGKPLVLGEFGFDSLREGEAAKCEMLSWQIEIAFRSGLAGAVVFTFSDEWFKDGRIVEDWKMGLVASDRQRKDSFDAVRKMYEAAPYFPLPETPKVSVVVASHNGERTLKFCLDSLKRLNYPAYEIILVDDGSTDTTARIASLYPEVRYFRHPKNLGLSIARNTGIAAATGDIVAFTDDDCRADEDWLYYLVGALLGSEFVGVGGPNLLPPEDSSVAAAVMVSPGGPAHVMLSDRHAEHIPGCNMAFFRQQLQEIGGFDPIFTRAGDDVDVCWRLQQAGFKIGFSPSGFVWHYRRSTLGAYLRQQKGYGEAEAMLVRKHPENFNSFGNSIWRGRIYAGAKFGVELRPAVIYHGLFGSAGYQKLYSSEPATTIMLCTTLEYHLFVTLPSWILTVVVHHLLALAIAALLIPVGVCVAAAIQAPLPRGKREWWSRPLVALLFFLQPIVRGWARHRGRLAEQPVTMATQESLDSMALLGGKQSLGESRYWAQRRVDRFSYVAAILRRLDAKGWPNRSDVGWSEYDVEIYGSRWSHLQLATVAEDHPNDRQMIRCRLRTTWSLTARIAFWSLAALELLAIGSLPSWRPWSWLVLVTLGGLVWFFMRDQRNLQSVVTVMLDELAKEQGLVKIRAETSDRVAEPSRG